MGRGNRSPGFKKMHKQWKSTNSGRPRKSKMTRKCRTKLENTWSSAKNDSGRR
ncbi:hypothetical protein sscle_16g107490 [Sclerotinia sclerotiorum 1980 UF-70]|uniref:Uncharacterized protein n=1 Tax=Sclerotinia sclerotiorum (strain ATCC 18683 / 1980 / Ss-1) TaxID=665079 RepID=A0A1D9QM82_SCLS1|nr:hypothetical protein sscle_16g107490 [Sclerotinia sclerotiorum 1980 UF-70]